VRGVLLEDVEQTLQHRNLVAFAAAVSDAFMLSDNFGRSAAGRDMHDAAHGPGSIAALRAAIRNGHEPPPAQRVAALASYRWFVVGTVCIGGFMGQVDSSIAQLLLPRLELEFDARLSTVSWVAVAYLLAMAAFLPIFGRLADIVGRKLLYTGGFLLFVLGSALCGFAPNLPILIAFRVLQAIGAALLSSNSVAIVVAAAGPERRGRALGILSAAQAVGLSAGPAIGGLVLDALDWRWVFWINVPFGLAGTIIGWFVLPPTKDLPDDGRFDWKGAFLIAPALTALVAVLNEGYAWGATSPALLGCALLAIILLTLFIRAERRADAPLIDLKLFRVPAFAAGNMAGLMSYAALFGIFFLMPFIFVRVYRDSILAAGLRLSIVPVMLGAVAPVGGALYDRLGARTLTASGMLICVIALILLFAVLDGAPSGLPLVMLALAVFGVGQGLFISPNNSAIMAAAPASLTGEAGGLLNVMRSFGISVGVAAASSLLSWRLAVLTGSGHSTLHADAPQLLSAGGDVIVLLAGFAAIAGAISLATPSRRARGTSDALA
jgi:EmrB/QacA subfamily drug resistance transporter